MMISSFVGGVFLWAVHPVLQKNVQDIPFPPLRELLKRVVHERLSESNYGLFIALLGIVVIMGIPATGLQTIFAQQAAAAVDEKRQRQLRGTVRTVLATVSLLWAISLLVVFVLRDRVLGSLGLTDSSVLWITMLIGLPVLWTPVLGGLLQGQQNFMWYGWASITGGLGRCLAAFVIVRVLDVGVLGAISAVLLGAIGAFVIYFWQSYADWHGPREPVEWRLWLRRVLPLTIGLGAITFILAADAIVVRKFFPQTSGFYGAAATIGKALVFFTIPLTSVMFPKIVQSAARAERTDVMAQALGATALLGGGAAIFFTLFPGLPLRLVYSESFLVVKSIIPWFAWCMLPLTLSNVLVNNLLARERFRVVPWMLAIALAYGATLWIVSPHLQQSDQVVAFRTIVQILGAFSLLLLLVCSYFTWQKK